VKQSPFGIIEWNDEFEFVEVNGAATDILGYDESELLGCSWEVIVPPADHGHVEAQFRKAIEGDDGSRTVNRNVRDDGEIITCAWYNSAVTNEDGEVSNLFSKFRDVTDERNDHRRLEALIDTLPGMVYQVKNEPPWPIEFVRGSCQELTGHTAHALTDDIETIGDLIHPDDFDAVTAQVGFALETDTQFDIIYRIQRKDDSIRWVWERGAVVENPLQGGRLLEGLMLDVTDLPRAGRV